MKKIYLLLAIFVMMYSCGDNPAFARKITYTDYGVNTAAEFDSALTAPTLDEDDGKRININSDINLLNDLSAPSDNSFIINGNNKTIDGGGKAGLSTSISNTTVINDLTMTNFKAPANEVSTLGGQNASIGGAILHQRGELNIFNSHFTNNVADGGIAAIGGAIANYNTTDSALSGTANIYNSSFVNNKVGITVLGRGGAIYNAGTMNIYSSEFLKNIANYADSSSAGGAIMNEGTLNIYNSIFGSDNIADANKSYDGGAIYNTGSNFAIYNSTFKNNVAANNGGAIYNMGSGFRVYDSTFTSNTAASGGGAIYNNGSAYVIADKSDVNFTNNASSGDGGAIYNDNNLYLIANNGGINFTGNAASNLGNDIYNNLSGSLYLNSGIGDITFNGGIYSNMGGIYINSPLSAIDGLTVPTIGRIILNSGLTTAGGTSVNLYDGMLQIVNNAGDKTGSLNVSELNLRGNSTLNLADGFVNSNVTVGMLNTSGTSNIWMDANLNSTSPTTDYLTVGTWGSMPLPNFTFRVLNDEASSGKISILSVPFDLSTASSIAYTNHYKYIFTGTMADTPSGFTFVRSGDGSTYDGLKGAIQDSSAFRSFSLVGSNYITTSNLPTLSAGIDAASTKTLTVFGTGKNGLAISGGGNYSLFNVPQYAQLNIVDAVIKNALVFDANGSAINNSGTLNVYDSLFNNNKSAKGGVDVYGGAIYNTGTAYIVNTDFTRNFSFTSGGAIANSGSSATMNIFKSTFTNNTTANYSGGAISNTDGATLNIADSTFGGNDISYANSSGVAGAIYNNANLNIYNSTFKFNKTTASNGNGGAFYNDASGTTNTYNSVFNHNQAYYGGAISNSSGTLNLYNSAFTNNTANKQGGAIYSNGGTVSLIASSGDVTFTGNTATNGGNDIYLTNRATLNLNSALGNKITFNGGIKSSAIADATININKEGSTSTPGEPPADAPSNGEVILGAAIETSNVVLHGGTLTLNNDSYLNGSALTLERGTLNMQNGAAGTMALSSLTVNGSTNLKIDADLAAGTSDKIDGAYNGNVSHFSVNSIKLLSDSTSSLTSTQLLGSGLVGHNLIDMYITKAYTPIYQYNVSYDDSTGKLTFAGGGSGGGSGGGGGSGSYNNFNPAILNAPVSANVGAYMTQVSVYNEALGHSELFMSLPQQERLLMKYRNKYANIGGNDVQPEVFSPTFLPDERGGIWFKQYTSFENVPMNNGPNVSNVGYGVLIGADSPMYHLKHGCDGYLTTYVAYNGSHQNYDQVGVNQNGGALGVTGTLYKGNFFTALTASVGDSYGQANTMYGVDNFNTLLAGLAWKSGYNIEMAQGKFILQPSFLAAYTFANTFDYTTASGVSMTSDPMNAIQLAPGVKFIANMKNGWQPYLAANMIFNIMDVQKFQANDVQLPQMSISPYIEYGLGVQRRWGERFTGFGQAMLRGGGRNGIALQFGFRIAIGK